MTPRPVLPKLYPWEKATGVTEALQPGVLPSVWDAPLFWGLMGALMVLLWPLWGWYGVVLAAFLARLVVLDLTAYTLPDVYVWPLLAVGAVQALARGDMVLMGAGALLALAFIFMQRRYAEARLGLGEGDIKLLLAMFGWLGPLGLAAAVLVGCVVWLPAVWRAAHQPLPLGVPLLVGFVLVLTWPDLPQALFSTITVQI